MTEAAAGPAPDPAHLQRVVAVDGPSGSGKSTVARALAERLGFQYLDTGAMYRAVTLHLLRQAVPLDGAVADLERYLDQIVLRFVAPDRVLLGDEDVTEQLRSRAVEARVSAVAAIPEVRRRMRDLQRAIAAAGPVVAEGRDMASVVFPAALWKFYLDATPQVRARRRCADFQARGRPVTEAEVLAEIEERDRLDSTRAAAPLQRTAGATYVDTSGLTLAQVIDRLAALVAEPTGGAPA